MTTIPIASVLVTDRQRQDLGDLDRDFRSIKEIGLIQPVVIEAVTEITGRSPDTEETKYRLISGGRRLTWLKANGFTELFHGTTCDPQRPGYVLSSELNEIHRQEAELYENIKRHKLSWLEECKAIARVHRLRWIENKAAALAWSQEHTASMLGIKGAARVTYALQIADEVRDNHESPVLLCATYSDAIKFLIERTERLARNEQDKRRELANQLQIKLEEPKGDLPLEEIKPLEEDISPLVTIQLSAMCHHGTIDFISESLPCDHYRSAIVFDKRHDWLLPTYRLMAANAFVVWAHGGVYQETNETASPFKVLPWPVVWNILDLDPKPPLPFALNMSFFDILTKGEPISSNPQGHSVISANMELDRFAVPDTVVEFLLKATSIDGDDVLMPMGGPVGIVANMGRRPCCVEKDEDQHKRNIETLKQIYNDRHSGNVTFL